MICLKTWTTWTVPFALVLILTACGGNHDLDPRTDTADPVISTDSGETAALPGLGSLPEATHSLSVIGPGWYEVPLNENLATVGEVTPHPDDELPLAAASSPSFAIFGVHDFDGDSSPTGARVLVSDVTGEYYIGVSNYESGNWDYEGPFTGMATVEFPHVGEFYDPTIYTSPGGSCYLSVVLQPGSSLTLSRVELGVDGGDNAPEAPILIGRTGGPAGTQMYWRYGDDYYRPDFAGFQVERAPAFSDDFALLTTDPVFNTCYTDETTTVNVMYRYRLSALDCNGNVSYGSVFSVVPTSTGNISPVAILDYPRGPLYGPVEVTFDLSASYDPEGEALTSYEIRLGGYEMMTLSGATPVFTVTLQPGCYLFSGSALTATDIGFDIGRLKVYPRWDTPVTARACTPSVRRMGWLSTARHPATGELLHVYTSTYTDEQLFCYETGDGGLDVKRFFHENFSNVLNRPCPYGTSLVVHLQSEHSYSQIRDNGDNVVRLDGCLRGAETRGGFTGDGAGRFWMAYDYDDGIFHNLRVDQMANATSPVDVVPSSGELEWIDMAYNPTADALDIAYLDIATSAMRWVRYPIGGVPGTPVEVDPGVVVINPIIEQNPATGRPAIVYGSAGYYYYTELAADLVTWSVPVAIDNSEANWYIQDFIFTENGPVVSFPLLSGSLGVYTYDGSWTKQQEFADPLGFATTQTLAEVPGSTDVILTYADQAFSLVSYLCHADGTSELRWEQPGIEGQGRELHAASAADGIHAVMRLPDNSVLHLHSPDGTSWGEETGLATGSQLGLASSSTGELFISYNDGTMACMDWWDSGSWNNILSITTSTDYRFTLQHELLTDGMLFCGYSDSTGFLVNRIADESSLYLAFDVMTSEEIWNLIVGYRSSRHLFTLNGTGYVEYGDLSHVDWDDDNYHALHGLYSTYIGDENPYLLGRTLGTAQHLPEAYGLPDCAYWATWGGADNRARRYWHDGNTIDYEDITIAPEVLSARRTVSAVSAGYGGTAVALLADFDDDHAVLEWSSFSTWEQLPLPEMERMQAPELVVGMDGRWHIIYRDWLTDDIMCISTL